ncbi:MAG: peptide chain release factor 1 [Gemmatimonadetes bacterium]|nr:peptide chain release factor 1 [Gemmatimonadota bacterium]NIQ58029.1 peptide chain release factor 1 [Gemmatimonadota bacterium]NIU78212.1 peptide chain release factor 1 [Gammaproteobacteria bacterium]NIX47201.1 peptide chain release factor 1 [Gemmatimonadota bacterium]NIY11577.1 peptide chain release factor 1 [Gemmatimonadota bacterium]
MSLETRLEQAVERHRELNRQLAEPEVLDDPDRLRKVAQEHAELTPLAESAEELGRVRRELAQAREMVETAEDPEMVELAESEVESLAAREGSLLERVKRLLVPKDPLADRAAVVEVRAGTGGDEAALFAGDLVRMYLRYAESRSWRTEMVDVSEGEVGGYREASFIVRGKDAYGDLRSESGVHRVQRVPETESQGRIHTSAATVAVLPEAEDVDVEMRDEDLRIDVFRSSGPGGQSVNTTDSAVRITHEPTGLVVTCQDEKSQHKNKAKAMKVLRSRLLDRKIAEQEAERARERKMQVGTGDRSAKIRTYNFPQGRVTDHRINLTLYRLDDILDGDLDEIVEALKLAREEERLAEDAVA